MSLKNNPETLSELQMAPFISMDVNSPANDETLHFNMLNILLLLEVPPYIEDLHQPFLSGGVYFLEVSEGLVGVLQVYKLNRPLATYGGVGRG